MKILTHKQGTLAKSNKNVKVILLDTPGEQAQIGIVMPYKTTRKEPGSSRHKLIKS